MQFVFITVAALVLLSAVVVVDSQSTADKLAALFAQLQSGEITKAEFVQKKKAALAAPEQDESATSEEVEGDETLPENIYGVNQECPPDWEITGVNEWIQGETSLDAGSLTILFYMSTSCSVCHEVAPYMSMMHSILNFRGLQVIAIHSAPKGHSESPEQVQNYKEWISINNASFSAVDSHSKPGDQPMKEGCVPSEENKHDCRDMEAAALMETDPESLWNKVATPNDDTPSGWAAQPYGVPTVFVLKNCELITQTGGYQTRELDQSLGPYFDRLLWPVPPEMNDLSEDDMQDDDVDEGEGEGEEVELKDEV
jgi:hypothetical protein